MRFSVIIPTLAREPHVLRQALESLTASDPPPHEVVVVDGSEDGAAAGVVADAAEARSAAEIRYFRSGRGASLQRNAGIDAVRGDVVVFIDDDATVSRDLFRALAAAYDESDVVGATGRVVQERYRSFGNQQSALRRLLFGRGRDGTMTSFGYPRHLQRTDVTCDVEFMQGCLMSVRRSALDHLRFDVDMGGPHGAALLEDEDFSYRVSRVGRVRHHPDAVVYHHASGFHSRDAREYSRLIVLDRAYLLRKNFSPTLASWLRFGGLVALFLAHRTVNREWRGLVGIVEGVRDAFRDERARAGSSLPAGARR